MKKLIWKVVDWAMMSASIVFLVALGFMSIGASAGRWAIGELENQEVKEK